MNMDSITKTDAGYQVFFVKDDFALTLFFNLLSLVVLLKLIEGIR